jgi:glutaredoxin
VALARDGRRRDPADVAEQLTVFWRPGCPFCMRLRARLAIGRVPYEARNIHEDPAAAAEVRSVNGGDELVPTARIGADRYLSNPSYRELRAALRG